MCIRDRFPLAFKQTKEVKLFMTLLVKNEEGMLEENLQFHKAMGVDGDVYKRQIPYIPDGKTTAGQIHHFIGYLFDSFMYIRYFSIYNYFHLSKTCLGTKVDTFTE